MTNLSYNNVSLAIPAYNEEDTLRETVENILNELDYQGEIIIVEDGCTDQTPQIARDLQKEYTQIKHIHSDKRLGKANAIKKAFETSENPILAFADSDTPSAYQNIPKIIKPIQEQDYDLVIGDRNSTKEAKRGILRKIHTTYTNKLIDVLLDTGVKDHQCGFKAIKKTKYEAIKPNLKSDNWFLDIELIYYAQKNNFKIKSVPVIYTSDDENTSAGLEIFKEFFETINRIKKEENNKYNRIKQYSKFGIIGGIGAIINIGLLYVLTDIVGLYYMLSAIISTEAAIISMFFLNNKYTFKPIKKGIPKIAKGIIRSNMVRSLGIIAQLALLYLFTEYFNIYYLLSNALAILIASLLTFYGEKNYNWK